MKRPTKADIIRAGRESLVGWLEAAKAHGTIYYTVEASRSGMMRTIRLSTITPQMHITGHVQSGLERCWPKIASHVEVNLSSAEYSSALDIVAKDWGFSFKHGAFRIGGCGMDMVFALVDNLAAKAGIKGHGKDSYANSVRLEAF